MTSQRRTDRGWSSLDHRQRGVLGCTLSANALVFFDQTAVTVALPAIGRSFHATTAELQWVITAYLLALAVFMPVAGRLADHFGRKRVFLGGLALFGAASVLCAVAPTLPLLLATRFVQGIGGAVVQPLAMSTTTGAVSDAQRGWAIGALATGGTSFLAVGPLLGGALLIVDWRVLFLAPLPVLTLALVLGARFVSPSRESTSHPISWGAVGLLLVGLATLVTGVVTTARLGLAALGMAAGGLVVLAVFVHQQRRSAHPLIAIGLLRNGTLAASLAALFAIQFAVFGVTVPLALYLQHGLGQGPLVAGAVLALAGLGTPLLSLTTGRLADRLGPRALVLPGLGLATTGLVVLALLAPMGGVLVLLPGLLLFAAARPTVFTPAGIGPFAALGPQRRAFAASLATESRQLGAVLGVAVTTAAGIAAYGPLLVEGDQGLVHAFRAAVWVAAGVCAAAALLVWRRMPE